MGAQQYGVRCLIWESTFKNIIIYNYIIRNIMFYQAKKESHSLSLLTLMELHTTINDDCLTCDVVWVRSS